MAGVSPAMVRVGLGVMGILLVLFAMAVIIFQPAAWPVAAIPLVVGPGLLYAALSGQPIRELGPQSVKFDPVKLVQKTIQEASGRLVSAGAATGRGEAFDASVRTVQPEPLGGAKVLSPTVQREVTASDSAMGRDEASVEKLPAPEEFEQLAMFAKTEEQLAKVIVDAIAADQARRRQSAG